MAPVPLKGGPTGVSVLYTNGQREARAVGSGGKKKRVSDVTLAHSSLQVQKTKSSRFRNRNISDHRWLVRLVTYSMERKANIFCCPC